VPHPYDGATTVRRFLRPRTRVRNLVAPRIRINVYLVIRFSLRHAAYMRAAFGDEAQRADWFAMRSQLFEASVVASMDRQSVAPRRVFVLMDNADEDLWQKHLNLPAPYVPLFVSAQDAHSEVARRIAADGTKNVVLSRLDSDDAVSARYVEKVARRARDMWRQGLSEGYMVACNGYITDLQQIQEIYFNCSPFISLYTRRYNGENIFDGEHTEILQRKPQMLEDARWMQIVHGSNIAHRTYKESKFGPDDERIMQVGELKPLKSAWPKGFPTNLPADARAVREAWQNRSAQQLK